MKKWLLLAVLAGLAVLAYAAAGPYLTMHRIEKSIAAQNLDSLSAQIDFPAVRAGLKAQLQRKIEAETITCRQFRTSISGTKRENDRHVSVSTSIFRDATLKALGPYYVSGQIITLQSSPK